MELFACVMKLSYIAQYNTLLYCVSGNFHKNHLLLMMMNRVSRTETVVTHHNVAVISSIQGFVQGQIIASHTCFGGHMIHVNC